MHLLLDFARGRQCPNTCLLWLFCGIIHAINVKGNVLMVNFRRLHVVVAAGAVVMCGALVAQETSLTDAYVQNGLVVSRDAIEDQGPGQPHSNEPSVWLDAAGHGYGLGQCLSLAKPVWTDDEQVSVAWTGTLDGLSGQEENPTIDVPVERPSAIRAAFSSNTHTPRTATWTGGSAVSASDWDDAANWDGEVPDEGDDVVFGSVKTARTIILTHETPQFNSLTIDSKNTLMTSNWLSKIQATTVTVKKEHCT